MLDLIGNMKRTNFATQIGLDNLGEKVTLMGWVHRRRDLGGLIFIDLRDISGKCQIVFNPEKEKLHEKAHKIRNEYVIGVEGTVVKRDEKNINKEMKTGAVEIDADSLKILNTSQPLPVQINEKILAEEDLRLKYRYLDLRRERLNSKIILRHKIVYAIRKFLNGRDFYEIETPMLMKSTPEGARDYLVPSRIHAGKFFALPQSPQMYKQLLMISGFDKYFQIARCFRDEDLRADRQPEFTQLDLEMSFATQEDIFKVMEDMFVSIFAETIDYKLDAPFRRMSYREAMDRYGTDKPDLRFDLELKDISDIVEESEFKVFSGTITKSGVVKCIVAPQAAGFSRKEIDKMTDLAKHLGGKGLAYTKVKENDLKSGVSKFLSEKEKQAIMERCDAEDGDLILYAADKPKISFKILGEIRNYLGNKLDLIDKNEFNFVWITDFPLFEYNDEEERWETAHHMFTLPKEEHLKYFEDEADWNKIQGQLYDLVCNGVELSSGSIRCHRLDIQKKIFNVLGFKPEELERKFGFFLNALKFGTPPHGGIAPGIDRIVMLMSKAESLREVIAFPKTLKAVDLMSEAPAAVDEKQTRELNIIINKK